MLTNIIAVKLISIISSLNYECIVVSPIAVIARLGPVCSTNTAAMTVSNV